MDIKELTKKAIENEENGIRVYTECIEKAKNPIVQKVFAYLAEQEITHIDRIKSFQTGNLSEEDLPSDAIEKAKKAFSGVINTIGENVTVDISDKEAYQKGLELEQLSYDLYEQGLKDAKTELEKKFFSFLMAEEKAHFELLQKSLDLLEHPTHWTENEEGWFL